MCFWLSGLAVHARNSGGVRLGNLMLDSHLLGPGLLQLLITASQTPVDNPLDTGVTHAAYQGISPETVLFFSVWCQLRCPIPEDALTMLPWQWEKKQLFIKVTWVFDFSGGLIKFLSYAFSFGHLPSARVVAECNL